MKWKKWMLATVGGFVALIVLGFLPNALMPQSDVIFVVKQGTDSEYFSRFPPGNYRQQVIQWYLLSVRVTRDSQGHIVDWYIDTTMGEPGRAAQARNSRTKLTPSVHEPVQSPSPRLVNVAVFVSSRAKRLIAPSA